MSNLFDITGDDIAKLNDSDLRTLIGLLCEADYRRAGLPTNGIMWGGHQNAKDGGLDVVVKNESLPPHNSYVPRSITGFQVKKPDMPRSEILKEMRPQGILRNEIKNLIQSNAAYIIVSSSGSTAKPALKNRIKAMKDAVVNEDNYKNFYVDFFDRGRVASWVRSHYSLILWVRNKIGRRLKGWQPYGNWAGAPGGIDEDYLLDDGLRLHDGTKSKDKGMSVEKGILNLRSALSIPRISLRLAGLSGVGKTRLVQALFDERVGEQALNPSLAFYTDMSDSPDPDPKTFAEQLIAEKIRAIIIVDNCPPDLHRRLTQTCSGYHSTVSLLSVEYDVRDDLPEETSVFRLEPASVEVIENLIDRRFPHISQVDTRTIANFSGGNARVAITLANTVKHGETLSGFRDDELFERLFRQRHDLNESLLLSAEVCSLVYSFEGMDASSENSELLFLASLINKTGLELYRDVATLKKRDLIQSRGVWKAILPHAISNRLAKRALESIPKDKLVQSFLHCGSERLIKSFTRRLNYLHDCEIAVEIVKDWLADDGWIGKVVGNLNTFGMEVFKNIAPVSPEKTLEAIEHAANGELGNKFTTRENNHFYEFVQILRHIAYDPNLFDRSVKLVCRYALSESEEENNNSIRDVLKSLFYIYLSGTHAPIEKRAKIIEELVYSEELEEQELGLFILDATLESWHFSSANKFEFGARPRDFGYQPRSREDAKQWYETFIGICTKLAISKHSISNKARKVLSDNLRGLWTKGGMFEALENAVRQIHEKKPWNEGWISLRGIIRYDSKGFDHNILKKLYRLEALLKPNDLIEEARTFVLSGQSGSFMLEDDIDDDEEAISGWERVTETTRKIGSQVAQDETTFNILLPELLSAKNGRLHSFGRGLAEGSHDKQKLWETLRSQTKMTPLGNLNVDVLLGFLSACGTSDSKFFNSILDELLKDPLLGKWFPVFQTTAVIDKLALKRLHEALDIGDALIHTFKHLAWGRIHETIGDDDLAVLLKKIYSKEGGDDVVIEILKMRFHRSKSEIPGYSRNLLDMAREVISKYQFPSENRRNKNIDYELEQIARVCLSGDEGSRPASDMCQNFISAIIDSRVFAFDYPGLLNSLAKKQPIVFLDAFLGSDKLKGHQYKRMFFHELETKDNPLSKISDKDIIAWCDADPAKRYSSISLAIQGFSVSSETGNLEWIPVVYSIFEKAPELSVVLDHLSDSIVPMSWVGSRGDILQKRVILFESLYQHNNVEIRDWARNQRLDLQERITWERQLENHRTRERNECFE